jgi:hypothetical protein
MKNRIITVSAFTAIAATSSVASGNPRETLAEPMPAMTEALEITIAGTYLQGAGGLGGTMDSADITTPGGGAEIGVGYRATPNLTIGGYATINGFADHGSTNDTATGSVGINAIWHVDPMSSIDPWVSVGGGVKRLWSGGQDVLDRSLFGVERLNARVGVDYRLSRWFAIGPAVGVSLTTYTHEDDNTRSGYRSLDDKDVNLTMSAGLQGRFDVPGFDLVGQTR